MSGDEFASLWRPGARAAAAPQPGPGEGPWQGPGPDAGAGQGFPPGPGAPPAGPAGVVISAAISPHSVLAAPAGGLPVVGRRAGQRLARTELSKAIYHPQPSLTERAVHFVMEWLGRLFRATPAAAGRLVGIRRR